MGGRVMGEVERQESIDTAPFRVNCSWCGDALTEPGALIFSPPTQLGAVWKDHVCVDCWEAYPMPHQPGTLRNDAFTDAVERETDEHGFCLNTGCKLCYPDGPSPPFEPQKFEGHTVFPPPTRPELPELDDPNRFPQRAVDPSEW